MKRIFSVGFCCLIAAFFVVSVLTGPQVFAQVKSGPPLAERINASISPTNERVQEIDKLFTAGSLTEEQLTELRAELEEISTGVLKHVNQFQPEFVELGVQLDRLPALPAEGEPDEPSEIAAERKRLSDAKSKATVAIKDAELLSVQSASLLNRVLEARRKQFVSSLLKRRTIDQSVFTRVADGGPELAGDAWRTISNWFSSTIKFNFLHLILASGLLVGICGLIFWLLRPFRRWIRRLDSGETIMPLQRITLAFFNTVIPGAAAAIVFFAANQLMREFGLYRLRIDQIVPSVLFLGAGLVFVWLLLRAVLAPRKPKRRLIEMTDAAAHRLFWLGMIMAVIYGLDYLTSQLITIFSAPVAFTIVKSLVATLLIAVVLVFAVMTRLKPVDPDAPTTGFRGWNRLIYWLVWSSVIGIVLASISGYLSLGRFIAGQIIITGPLLVTMYIGFQASQAIAGQGALASTHMGQRIRDRNGASDLRLDQYGLLISILINVIVLLIGLPILLLQWGFQADDIGAWARQAITGFSVGGVNISFGRVLMAIGVFALLIWLTRYLQRWFEGKVLARTQLDSGVRNSVKAGLGYVGFFIAALVGISWAGFNLSNIALIAGALSVGIGFGLQNIVNNFVSGIIMLIERPIKVGDIIAVAGSEGFVRKINVRATELETFDRQSVIIPNSEVINTSVGNWMHSDRVRRIIIAIGVAYGSDVEKVRQVLLDCLKDDDRVASHPAPFVHFSDFGASSLDFQLRFFIRDIMDTPVVETDIRFAIDRAFRENDIEIPFPQTDLHIKSGLPAEPKATARKKKT